MGQPRGWSFRPCLEGLGVLECLSLRGLGCVKVADARSLALCPAGLTEGTIVTMPMCPCAEEPVLVSTSLRHCVGARDLVRLPPGALTRKVCAPRAGAAPAARPVETVRLSLTVRVLVCDSSCVRVPWSVRARRLASVGHQQEYEQVHRLWGAEQWSGVSVSGCRGEGIASRIQEVNIRV